MNRPLPRDVRDADEPTVWERELLLAAREAAAAAYAPYSGFAVGAAVRAEDGSLFLGANQENAAYGVTICAEVAALTAAQQAGKLGALDAIAVTGLRFREPIAADALVTPCGRCRQLISEASALSRRDLLVLCASGDMSRFERWRISELLPASFGPATIGEGVDLQELSAAVRLALASTLSKERSSLLRL